MIDIVEDLAASFGISLSPPKANAQPKAKPPAAPAPEGDEDDDTDPEA